MDVYEVEIGGISHPMQLSDEDLKRYPDAKKVTAKALTAAAADGTGEVVVDTDGDGTPDTKAATAPANKSGAAATK